MSLLAEYATSIQTSALSDDAFPYDEKVDLNDCKIETAEKASWDLENILLLKKKVN